MKIEDYEEGMTVLARKQHGIAVELEECNDGSFVVHVAFPGKDSQWRVPIEQVEVDKT